MFCKREAVSIVVALLLRLVLRYGLLGRACLSSATGLRKNADWPSLSANSFACPAGLCRRNLLAFPVASHNRNYATPCRRSLRSHNFDYVTLLASCCRLTR